MVGMPGVQLLLLVLLAALLPSPASPTTLDLTPALAAAHRLHRQPAVNASGASPFPPALGAFNITASMERARPARPAFSNTSGCLLAERPSASALAAARDAAWTLAGLPVQACCDDLNCDDPSLPQHPGDCDKKIKCGAPCPAEPVDGLSAANLNPLGAFDVSACSSSSSSGFCLRFCAAIPTRTSHPTPSSPPLCAGRRAASARPRGSSACAPATASASTPAAESTGSLSSPRGCPHPSSSTIRSCACVATLPTKNSSVGRLTTMKDFI